MGLIIKEVKVLEPKDVRERFTASVAVALLGLVFALVFLATIIYIVIERVPPWRVPGWIMFLLIFSSLGIVVSLVLWFYLHHLEKRG
jgi:Co/Zn/Cd efflux system component